MAPFKPDSAFPRVHGVGRKSRDDDLPQGIVPRISTPTRSGFGGNGRHTVKLDFASKGLTQVEFKQIGKDEGPEARLQGTAMYSPTPGWPLYTAGRSMQDNGEGLKYPVKVNFRVALTNFPEGQYSPSPCCTANRTALLTAMTTLRRNTKVYLDLLDNGYDWHERFIGMWKVAEEGTWAISIHREAMTLPEYWAAKIQPGVSRMEAKWKANHSKKRRLDDPQSCSPIMKGSSSSSSSQHTITCGDRWTNRSLGDRESARGDGVQPSAEANDNDRTSQRIQRFDVSDLRQELIDVADSLGDMDGTNLATSPLTETQGQATPKEETALAGGKSRHGEEPVDSKKHGPPRYPRRRRTSIEQEEADRAELEREWVHAVEILIQLADCLLVSAPVFS